MYRGQKVLELTELASVKLMLVDVSSQRLVAKKASLLLCNGSRSGQVRG